MDAEDEFRMVIISQYRIRKKKKEGE